MDKRPPANLITDRFPRHYLRRCVSQSLALSETLLRSPRRISSKRFSDFVLTSRYAPIRHDVRGVLHGINGYMVN